MAKSPVKPIPEGSHTLTPHLVIHGAAAAIEFYKKALGAKELWRHPAPDGRLMHAELTIGDSKLYLSDDFPDMGSLAPGAGGNSPVTIHLYVEDCDKVFNAAVAAGARVQMPLMNMFWGDRYGKFQDPFGHNWSVATHLEDVSPAEVEKRSKDAFGNM